MNLLAINFDASWFLTVPGMLITGGVVLLIIALIIFIATSGSSKKNDKENMKVDQKVEAAINPSLVDQNETIVVPEALIVPDNFTNNLVPPVQEPVIVKEEKVIETPIAVETPTVVEQVMPPIKDVPQYTEPLSVTPNTFEQEIPAPVNVYQTQVPEVKVEEVKVEEVKEQPAIYGGVSPTLPNIDLTTDLERTIYGGANPLENTQNLPITPNVHLEYGKEVVKEETVAPIIEPLPSILKDEIPHIEEPLIAPSFVQETKEDIIEDITPKVEVQPQEEIEILDF